MALPAFATPDQLAGTLGVDPPAGAAVGMWLSALDDASGHLRAVIGQPITAGTVTLSLTTDHRGEADVWLVPARITAVVDWNGDTVDSDSYRFTDQRLYLEHANSDYTVTVDYGYSEPPAEIVRWAKVLAAAQIQAAPQGSLGLSNVSSVAVDDGKVTYFQGMAAALPDSAAQWLRATFGGPQ